MNELIPRITAFFTQLDQEVNRFRLKTGLGCVENCDGACCRNANIHTTILEMLPVSHELFQRGEGAVWLERLSDNAMDDFCIFFQDHRKPAASGHCSMYAFRPSVCRLFGFAAVRNRAGDKILATCKYIKQAFPEIHLPAQAFQSQAHCFSDQSAHLYALEPCSANRLLPINSALRLALQRVGLYLQYLKFEI